MSRGIFDPGPRLLSAPVGVEWAGWLTDTVKLQRSGWRLAIEFDGYRHTYTLMMHHQLMKLYALCDSLELELERRDPWNHNLKDYPVFRVRSVAPSIQVIQHAGLDLSRFEEIDAEPQIVDRKITRIEDMNIFAKRAPAGEQILVREADMGVIEHLEAIKKLQAPKQAELRSREINGIKAKLEERPIAQIVSIAA